MPRGLDPGDEARLQGRLWTPAAESGDLSGWFDASARESLSFATGISQMRSRHSSAVVLEQGGGANQPAFAPAGINGRPAADFVGANHLMLQFTTANGLMANAFTAVLAFNVRATSGGNTRILTWLPTAGDDFNSASAIALVTRNAANSIQTFQNNAARATTTAADGELQIFAVDSDGTTCRHFRNGVAGGSGAWGGISLGAGRWGVGCFSSAGSSTDYRGLWGEAVIVRRHSPALRQRVEGYLAWKWGLQDRLAASHPHRNSPPLTGA